MQESATLHNHSSSKIELASGPKKGTSYLSSVVASVYALNVSSAIKHRSPTNISHESMLDQEKMRWTTKRKAKRSADCHAWNLLNTLACSSPL